MLDDIKKMLDEGFTIPITLRVNVQFKTDADEEIFRSLALVMSTEHGAEASEQQEEPEQPKLVEAPIVEKPVKKISKKQVTKAEVVPPILEVPQVETPVVEAPIVEIPVIEAPVAEVPIAEAPIAEVPIVEAPVIEVTKPSDKKETKVEEPVSALKAAGVKYTPVAKDPLLKYGEAGDVLVIRCKKFRFVTSWDEIDKLAKLSNAEFENPKILNQFGKVYKSYVGDFLRYYNAGSVKPRSEFRQSKLSVASGQKQVEKPVEKPAKKPLEDRLLLPVPGEKNLKYKTSGDILIIKYDDSVINTKWDEIARLADMSDYKLTRKIENLFKNDMIRQKSLLSFVRAYQDEKVRDPDAGFRKILNTNTSTKYGGYGGHVRGTLEDHNVPEE